MADDKKTSELDEGFKEIPLDKGFEEIPLTTEQKAGIVTHFKPPQASELESIREGYAQGGTLGYAPRIGAAMGAGLEKTAGAGLGPEGFPLIPGAEKSENKKLQDLYNEYLDYNNKLQEKAKASNPGLYHTAEFAGVMASPFNKIGTLGGGGMAAKDASILAKMGQSGLAGARMGALGGLSQSKDLNNLPEDVSNMGRGAAFGAGIGLAAPPVGAALSGMASGAGSIGRTVFGPMGQMFKKGSQAGTEGLPNLATEAGQSQAQGIRKEFAQKFVDDLKGILNSSAKNKRELIRNASQDVPKEQLDEVISKYLEANPKLNTKKSLDELNELKEIILTAKEGPLKPETVRVYREGAPERPLPSDARPFQPTSPEVEPMPTESSTTPADQSMRGVNVEPKLLTAGENKLPAVAEEGITGKAESMGVPPPESPAGFAGYEPVHKATIEAGDEEALAAFKHKIEEKLADERALGRNFNDNPIQIEQHKIPGSDKVRIIAKRAKVEEPVDEFAEHAKSLSDRQKEEARLQKLLDQQQEEQLKFQQQQDQQAAQPQFQDVSQQVRSGDRNIYSPEELYNLQQTLSHMSQFREGRGFSSPEVTKMAGDASKDLSGLIKQTAGTASVDQKIHAFNNIAESLGIDTAPLSMPGGTGEKAQADAMTKIFKLINPENLDDQTLLNQDKLQYIHEQLKAISPEMADNFLSNAMKQAESKGLTKEFSKPYEPSGINPFFNAIRRNASKVSYGTGYGLGQQVRKISSEIEPAVKMFQQYTPESLQQAASTAAQSSDATIQKFGQVLSKLATADERTRNSMLFVLQQQAGYKAMMDGLLGQKEQAPQAKNKSLEKYK